MRWLSRDISKLYLGVHCFPFQRRIQRQYCNDQNLKRGQKDMSDFKNCSDCNKQHFGDVMNSSRICGIRADYVKGESGGRLAGCFNDTGIMGMMGTSDDKSMDVGSPFIGVVEHRFCGLSYGSVTEVFLIFILML